MLKHGTIVLYYIYLSHFALENAKDLFASGKMIAYNSCLSRWAYPVHFFHAMQRESIYFAGLVTCDLLVRISKAT